MGQFVHLHVHSEYSFLDGLNRIKPLVARAQELNMKSLALTDHGGMFGMYEFVTACKEAEIKPIVGAELYVAKRTRKDKAAKQDQKSYHLTVLAKDDTGYHNLMKLVSFAHIEGFYYKPRIDRELLEKYNEGLVVLSGCIGGEVSRKLLSGRDEEAMDTAKYFKDMFGEDYYLEYQRFGSEEDKKLGPKLNEIARKLKIKRVATCDVHYLEKKQAKAQEVMWAIADGRRLDDPGRRTLMSDEFYLKSDAEMRELWKDDEEVLNNTEEVAEKCDVDISFKGFVLPDTAIPGKYKKDYDAYLKDRVYREAKQRLRRGLKKDEKKRIDYELGIIKQKEMSPYLIICANFADWMRSKDILVNTRGSAAGSMVAYTLGIVNANPLKFQLMFERFLNPERPKAPDVDFDIESGRRDEVIQHSIKEFGWESVGHIITYDRMRTRAVVRDVARTLGIPIDIVDKIAKLTPQSGQGTRAISLAEAADQVKELKDLFESDEKLKQLFDLSTSLDGISRHRGLHACGVLITPGPMWEHVPVVLDSDTGRLVTQYDFRALEDLGLLKMDFLGVENLDIIKDAIRLVKETTDEEIDVDEVIDKFSFDDDKTYKLIRDLDTLGVFQLESDVMKRTLSIIKPENIFDIGACLALVRPGPNAYQEAYGRRRAGQETVEYLDPRMKDFLERSFGVLVYQEDLIRCVTELAGYSWLEADKFRKFTGKKIPDILLDQKDELMERFVKKGMDKNVAEKLIELFMPFANYAFNEAHAASYSIITYLTAYLKANYTVEYMAALYKAHLEDQEKLGKISDECRRKSIDVLPPDINKSYEDFKIEGDKNIRFGLAGVKGVGRKVISHIVEVRDGKPFESLDDLLSRIDLSKAPKSALEALVKVGALDKFGKRSAMIEVLPVVAERWGDVMRLKRAGQSGLFSEEIEKETTEKTILPDISEVPEQEKLQWEKELLGTYVSTHPTQKIHDLLKKTGVRTIVDIKKVRVGSRVKVLGVLDKVRVITTKNGKMMAFLDIQDHTGNIDVTLFPKIYDDNKDVLAEGKMVVIAGKLDSRGGYLGVLADKVYALDDAKLKSIRKKIKKINGGGKDQVIVKIPDSATMDQLEQLNSFFAQNPGDTKVTVIVPNHSGPRSVVLRNGVAMGAEALSHAETLVPGVSFE